jgi:hypothetical protein
MSTVYSIYTATVATVCNCILFFLLLRRRLSRTLTALFMGIGFAVALATSFLHETDVYTYLVMVTALVFMTAIMLCFEGTFWQKFFVIWFILNISVLICFVVSPIAAAISPYQSDGFYLWLMIFMTVLYGVEIVFAAKYMREFFPKLFSRGKRGWIFCGIGTILSRLVLRVVTDTAVIAVTDPPTTATMGAYAYYLVIFASIWCLLSVALAAWVSYTRAERAFELHHSRVALAATRAHYEALTQSIDEAKRLRHDVRYMEATAATLAQKGDTEALLKLFSREKVGAPVQNYCQHSVCDALLGWYGKLFEAEGVRCSVRADIPADIAVEEGDLCVLLGNLLENALEASRYVAEGNRFVEVVAKSTGQLTLSVKNAYDGKLIVHKDNLLTRKMIGGGYGTKSVAAVCEKYHGAFCPEWDDTTFTALALLNFN